jgi:hypothetical protein
MLYRVIYMNDFDRSCNCMDMDGSDKITVNDINKWERYLNSRFMWNTCTVMSWSPIHTEDK